MDNRVYECLIKIRDGVKREYIDRLIDFEKQGIDVMKSITAKGLYLEPSDYEDIKNAIFDFKQGRSVVLNKPKEMKPTGVETTIKASTGVIIPIPPSLSEVLPVPVVMTVLNTPAASGTISKKK